MGPAMLQSCQLRIIKRNSCFIRLQITCTFYYMKTNEIPGELSHENIISLHVKIKYHPYVWKHHLCIGYIINDAFSVKMKWFGILLGFLVLKKFFTHLLCSLVKYFSTLEEKFYISTQPYKIALIVNHTFTSIFLNCALLCFIFKFRDIVDVVNGIFQEFSLPTFYKVDCTSRYGSSFSVVK